MAASTSSLNVAASSRSFVLVDASGSSASQMKSWQLISSTSCTKQLKPISTRVSASMAQLSPVAAADAPLCSSDADPAAAAAAAQEINGSLNFHSDIDLEVEAAVTTPKARAFRIPSSEELECPPAPRKKRAVGKKRIARATTSFSSSELELFFSAISHHKQRK